MGRNGVRFRGRAFHSDDARKLAETAYECGAELEMCGAGIVVDAQRQTALPCHCGEVLEHLPVRERGVGHRSQKTCVSPYGLSILGEPHGLIGAQRTDPSEDRHSPGCFLEAASSARRRSA